MPFYFAVIYFIICVLIGIVYVHEEIYLCFKLRSNYVWLIKATICFKRICTSSNLSSIKSSCLKILKTIGKKLDMFLNWGESLIINLKSKESKKFKDISVVTTSPYPCWYNHWLHLLNLPPTFFPVNSWPTLFLPKARKHFSFSKFFFVYSLGWAFKRGQFNTKTEPFSFDSTELWPVCIILKLKYKDRPKKLCSAAFLKMNYNFQNNLPA